MVSKLLLLAPLRRRSVIKKRSDFLLQIGSSASAYVAGAVIGALVFGRLTDRFGRRLVFYITLLVYLAGVLLTATSWSFLSFALFRAVTGLGIGGEYAAINSAIDELIPAKYRGRIDTIVNGSFWLGAAAGSGASLLFLDPNLIAPNLGWRLGFAVGGCLGLGILLLRRYVPESPRWLITHGYERRAEDNMADIERRVSKDTKYRRLPKAKGQLKVRPSKTFGFALIARAMLGEYRGRSGLALWKRAFEAEKKEKSESQMSDVAHSIDLNLPERLRDREFRQNFFLAECSAQIAAQLIALRKRRQLKQGEVADLVDTQQPAISPYEQADYQSRSFTVLQKIADALDARIRVLIEPSEDVVHEYDNEQAQVSDPERAALQDILHPRTPHEPKLERKQSQRLGTWNPDEELSAALYQRPEQLEPRETLKKRLEDNAAAFQRFVPEPPDSRH